MTLAAPVPDTWIGTLVRTVRESKKIRAVDAAREEEDPRVGSPPARRLTRRRAASAAPYSFQS